MFTLPIWVAVFYGIIMLWTLFLVFLLFIIVDRQKHLIERQQYFIRSHFIRSHFIHSLKGEDR